MPHRALNLLLVIGGILTVLALIIAGANLHRAARSGPCWRRRLVGAGLLVLAGLGIGGYSAAEEPKQTPAAEATTGEASGQLADTAQWKQITATWKEAEEIASGARGAYPFDEKGKKATLEALAEADRNVMALVGREALTAPEATLLKRELGRLTSGVQAMRPKEMEMATCYEPMAMPLPARESVGRLAERVPLLEQMLKDGRLKPEVVARVLTSVESDIQTLGKEEELARLPEEQREAAKKMHQRATEAVKQLQAQLSSAELTDTVQWKTIMVAWAEVVPLARSGESTTVQRKNAEEKLTAASQAAEQLAEKGMLSKAEAGLLTAEAERLRAEMVRNPPTDLAVQCYKMAYLPAAQASLSRLSARLPLLEQAIATGTLQPAVVEKVLPAIAADLETLSTKAELDKLPAERRAEAEKLVPKVQEAVNRIKAMLEEKPQPYPIQMCYAPPMEPLPKEPVKRPEQGRLLKKLGDGGRLSPETTRTVARTLTQRTHHGEGPQA